FDANDSSPYSGSVTISNGTDSVVVNVSLAILNSNRVITVGNSSPSISNAGNSILSGNICTESSASDPDGDTITATPLTNTGSFGTFVLNSDCSYTFTPQLPTDTPPSRGVEGDVNIAGITLNESGGSSTNISFSINDVDTRGPGQTGNNILLDTQGQSVLGGTTYIEFHENLDTDISKHSIRYTVPGGSADADASSSFTITSVVGNRLYFNTVAPNVQFSNIEFSVVDQYGNRNIDKVTGTGSEGVKNNPVDDRLINLSI
ncbi:Ig-like domain-containing protein, partial [Candidatus Gracilibacteria bacterium]|nr:Ig-like domain-containing protein [Candidatus Gracilibacteria bacterium]